MTTLKIGDDAPEFCLPDAEKGEVCLKDLKGKWIVLYFYPKDNTKGCTLEALDFTAAEDEFNERGTVILGVSPDSPESHTKFIEKHELGITLLSDTEKKILESYGAWQLKKMYGREFMGVVRSTYLIDPEGKIAYIWPKVRVKEHADKVMAKLVELQG
ncbi:MAG: thioredoxin-dependent thiol peroxidase [Candidatus Bathyarchaeota archaeon]|nr:thioredoxin-dependent thiol peroxidase [Candidatus Bathyarchaeota archaeon]